MPEGLDLSVDRDSDVPLGTQLVWKLRTLVATGALAPGTKLPGLREVAESAKVNVNTVRSVFARLEDLGLLVSEQGRGTFVAANARSDTNLSEAAAATIAQALASGVDPRELAAALYVNAATPPVSKRDERRALYEQIDRLDRELGRLEPLSAGAQRPTTESGPRLLTVAELREVRDSLEMRVDQLLRERQGWRVEAEQLRAEEREAAERSGSRPWRAGVWTGRFAATVSWTAG
ncbi:MAG: GntR family transcriptional regulator [Solirubrobacteraceae bacterium]